MNKCKFFNCRDSQNCPMGDSNCSGYGGVAFQNCGCDACIHHSFWGDVEICDVALSTPRDDMEEKE